ncbi:bifunctional precorrin-2 dehydrogenase/sirohydrochlorin ferrochelatase [Psychrobium sp. MM17-31]|uniref:precorrin-2 dehydrogenase/sirohydrochlorin ferrochelatase family protein n=1 Tax=Psychrobium sp. MM17-31 TaxID=2917758 RepID=UPI001EF6AED5|nr:bifunctional precorrin-2 dehydrogenase/sirohydrochlorin ferrochelatase [Psychrobium sp. MM17-31]MCG7532959.1 bifunctional precorrin-2 dehydrogenase/sirohydrochlorin ferrochelatase [Psychrobium sp. MM17-31]
MQYFPIFVDTQQLNVLVVGGGEVATRKIELLLKSEACVSVVSPDLSSEIQEFVKSGRVTHIDGFFDESMLEGRQLVFVATANEALNAQISRCAKALNVMANVVDSQELCHFITPSIIDRSPMVYAISSEGKAPVLVRYWRERLESLIPLNLGKIADFSGSKRQIIKDAFTDGNKRRRFWERFFSAGDSDSVGKLEGLFNRLFREEQATQTVDGELYVVQVTNDAQMLSLGALRHMQQSDIALLDNDIDGQVVELVRRDANVANLDANEPLNQVGDLLADNQRVCILTTKPVDEFVELCLHFESDYLIRRFNSALSIG